MSIAERNKGVTDLFYNAQHAVEILKFLNTDRKEQKTLCDGSVQSDKTMFDIHKSIVGVVSPFFTTFFATKINKNQNNLVKIDNISPKNLGIVIDFIYTGTVDLTGDNICDMLEAAEYTQITGLKTVCKQYLLRNVTVENCLKLRAYAERYDLYEVLHEADDVISKNYVDVVRQDDFQQLSLPHMLSILKMERIQSSETAIFNSIVRWAKHDGQRRQKFFVELFRLVDVSSLPEDFVKEKVTPERLIFESLECMQHLWTSTRNLKAARPVPESWKIILAGGKHSEKTCLIYEFYYGVVKRLPDLSVERCGAVVAKIAKWLFVCGGAQHPGGINVHKSAEILNLHDPIAWVPMAGMTERRLDAASTIHNGCLYVTGGWSGSSLSSGEKYNIDWDRWSKISKMLFKRDKHALVSFNGALYSVGGSNGNIDLKKCECYNERTDTWREVAALHECKRGLTAVAWNDHVYAIGGRNSKGTLKSVERYNHKSNDWCRLAPLNTGRFRARAFVLNGQVHVCGGTNDGEFSAEAYDEHTNRWTEIFKTPMKVPSSSTVLSL